MKKPLYLDDNTIRHVLSSPWPRGKGKSNWMREFYAAMSRELLKHVEGTGRRRVK